MDKQVEAVIAALEEHKVEDILALDVTSRTPFSTHYILGTALNERQLGTLSNTLEDDLSKAGIEIKGSDGTPESGWVIIDTGDFMIHLFTKTKREEMGLEELLSFKK